MARPSHRSTNQRDNYRPGTDDSDRGHERRGRSKSRERRRTPPPSRRRPESWRSPDVRDHDRPPPSRRERDRSTESRRSGRPLSPSPHRSSRIEKERARSPDIGESRHSRHSHKRRSPTPLSKRRRSVSPYPSSKKPSKKSKRPRSPIRPSSPQRRGRPRDSSLSPRRVASPRSTRKVDNRPSTRGSERSRSPMPHSRRRSYSRSPPRHQRQRSTSRHSHSTHYRASPRPSSRRRYSPLPSRRSPDTRRRTPPPRKRRDPPNLSPRNSSPASVSQKRRRLSRSPRADFSPLATSTTATQHETFKDQKSDRDFSPNLSRKSEKEHLGFSNTKKETSLRYSKVTSPRRSRSPVSHGRHLSRKPSSSESLHERERSPLRPIPSFESQEELKDAMSNRKDEEPGVNDNSKTQTETEDRQSYASTSPSDYRPASFTNGPHVNPERAARLKMSGGFGRGRGWSQESFHGRPTYAPHNQFSSTNTTSQGQNHGPNQFYQQHQVQPQYGQNAQMQSSYQPPYRGSNPSGGFVPNQFAPVSEPGHRVPAQHGFQMQATPPSQPRGRGINIYLGRGMGRGRFDSHLRHAPPPPPPPSTLPPPAPESNDSDSADPDDNPYRPASFRVRDELEEEQEKLKESQAAAAEAAKPTSQESAAPQSPQKTSPEESKQSQQLQDASQMPPPQSRPVAPASTPKRRPPPAQPASDTTKGFRPFSLSLNKPRNLGRSEPSQRLKSLVAREKAPELAPLQSAGAEATSQVVEALKAVAERERTTPSQPPRPAPTPHTPPVNPNDPYRFSVYERVTMVGEGTYGKVYKARNKKTNELVALKRIRMESERDGFPITAVREMKLLQSLKHVNIVSLLETMVERCPSKTHSDFYMVFEYMDHDLTGILNHPTFQLEPGHIKHLARQFFHGLEYLHHRGVLHRDIKASNILLDSTGLLKLADFGLARFYQKRKKGLDYTNRIITLWYRPPEILLGDTAYGPAVDIWSAGCVFAELFTRVAVFPGTTEINQLDVIYDILGTPTREDWPMLTQMPWYELLKPPTRKEPKFDDKYKDQLPPAALDLVKSIFSFDPEKRPTATEVLNHPYFVSEEPEAKPCSLAHLKGDWHEFEAKTRKRKERAAAREREAKREASSTGSGGPNATESRYR